MCVIFFKQISKVEEFLEEGVAKIEEFQSLFEMVI
jgi:hypothetical protein